MTAITCVFQLVRKVRRDFSDKLPTKLQNLNFVFNILQFWPLRRVIERKTEPISTLRAAAFAAVALRNASRGSV